MIVFLFCHLCASNKTTTVTS